MRASLTRLLSSAAVRPWVLGLWFALLALPLMYTTDPGYQDPYGYGGVHRVLYIFVGIVVGAYLWQLDQAVWPRLAARSRRLVGTVSAVLLVLMLLALGNVFGVGVHTLLAGVPGGEAVDYVLGVLFLVYALRGLTPEAAVETEPSRPSWWDRHRRRAAPLLPVLLVILPLLPFMHR